MIQFRRKVLEEDLIPRAIEHLKEAGVPYTVITPEQADKVSKINSKSMVLMSFKRSENNTYLVTVKDKEFYPYTRKLLGDPSYCRMKIVDENKSKRTFTAEVDHVGQALDAIEVLGIKYNLSIVQ